MKNCQHEYKAFISIAKAQKILNIKNLILFEIKFFCCMLCGNCVCLNDDDILFFEINLLTMKNSLNFVLWRALHDM